MDDQEFFNAFNEFRAENHAIIEGFTADVKKLADEAKKKLSDQVQLCERTRKKDVKRKREDAMNRACGSASLSVRDRYLLEQELRQFGICNRLIVSPLGVPCMLVLHTPKFDMLAPTETIRKKNEAPFFKYEIDDTYETYASFYSEDPNVACRYVIQLCWHEEGNDANFTDPVELAPPNSEKQLQCFYITFYEFIDSGTPGVYFWRVFEKYPGYDEYNVDQEKVLDNLVLSVSLTVTAKVNEKDVCILDD